MRRALKGLLIVITLFSVLCSHALAVEDGKKFEDVKESDYFYDSVYWAVENGITSGTSEKKFSPSDTCTRAQVMTFLWRSKGSPEPSSENNVFRDVQSSDYYFKAVLWAVEKTITAGTSEMEFSPNAPCTRGQVMTFLWAAEDRPTPKRYASGFTDVNSSDYYFKPVLWAVENNITAGVSARSFGPNQACSRAQVMTFLWRAEADEKLPEVPSDNSSWQGAYKQYLDSLSWAEKCSYSLIDVNDDDIPELVIWDNKSNEPEPVFDYDYVRILTARRSILGSYQVEALVSEDRFFEYIEKGNQLILHHMDNHYVVDAGYSIRDGKWIAEFEGSRPEEEYADQEGMQYTWNGEEVSREFYESSFAQVYDQSRTVTEVDKTSYTELLKSLAS